MPEIPPPAAPTQVKRPWRATARTTFQALLGLCALLPVVVSTLGWDDAPWLAVPLAVAAAACRIMALPAVEAWIMRYLPWLAAKPAPKP